MNCMERPEIAPVYGCRCPHCYRARQQSVPIKLRQIAYPPSDSLEFGIAKLVICRWLDAYFAGQIGLAEMQVELIASLVQQIDGLSKRPIVPRQLVIKKDETDV